MGKPNTHIPWTKYSIVYLEMQDMELTLFFCWWWCSYGPAETEVLIHQKLLLKPGYYDEALYCIGSHRLQPPICNRKKKELLFSTEGTKTQLLLLSGNKS